MVQWLAAGRKLATPRRRGIAEHFYNQPWRRPLARAQRYGSERAILLDTRCHASRCGQNYPIYVE
jgi:hypothetical protein